MVKCSDVLKCIKWIFKITRFTSVEVKEMRFYGNISKVILFSASTGYINKFCGIIQSSVMLLQAVQVLTIQLQTVNIKLQRAQGLKTAFLKKLQIIYGIIRKFIFVYLASKQ